MHGATIKLKNNKDVKVVSEYDRSLFCAVLYKLCVVISQYTHTFINPVGLVSSCLFVTLSVRLLLHPSVLINMRLKEKG